MNHRHVVLAWELGADLGHISRIAAIGRALTAKGYRVSALLSDTRHAERLLTPHGIAWQAAPTAPRPTGTKRPVNHAEILRHCGYASPTELHDLLTAWRSRLKVLQPDLLIGDATPTACLAARTLDIPRVVLDSGFFYPPLRDPLSPLRPGEPYVEAELQRQERTVLKTVNAALQTLGHTPLPGFVSLFRDETWWLNWPELNHFGAHRPERHLGPLFTDMPGAPLHWPAGDGPRVFAYLKPRHPHSRSLLDFCIRHGCRIAAYLPGWSDDALAALTRTGQVFCSQEPLSMAQAMAEADFALCHAGIGTVAQFVSAGKPLVLLPILVEQHRVARAAAAQQLALMPRLVNGELTMDTAQLAACGEHARRFAATHAMCRMEDLLAKLGL